MCRTSLRRVRAVCRKCGNGPPRRLAVTMIHEHTAKMRSVLCWGVSVHGVPTNRTRKSCILHRSMEQEMHACIHSEQARAGRPGGDFCDLTKRPSPVKITQRHRSQEPHTSLSPPTLLCSKERRMTSTAARLVSCLRAVGGDDESTSQLPAEQSFSCGHSPHPLPQTHRN